MEPTAIVISVPSSGKPYLGLHRVAKEFATDDSDFLLDSQDIRVLQEYVTLGLTLPESNEAFQVFYPKDDIREYLEGYDVKLYEVSIKAK